MMVTHTPHLLPVIAPALFPLKNQIAVAIRTAEIPIVMKVGVLRVILNCPFDDLKTHFSNAFK